MTDHSSTFQNEVIRASAGTGKTYQLSNRFIGLLATGEPIDSILATTFTRKAAGEILDRVLLRLAQAADCPAELTRLNQHAETALNRESCQGLLCALLASLHRVRVSTLDSFFIQIARSFGLELGLPPGWQIVDEITDAAMRSQAIREVLRVEATADVTKLMSLLSKGEVTRSVSDQIRGLVDELYSIYLEAPATAWQRVPKHALVEAKPLDEAVERVATMAFSDKRWESARQQVITCARGGDWERLLSAGFGKAVASGDNHYYKKPLPDDLVEALAVLVKQARAVIINRIAIQTETTHDLLNRFDRAYQAIKRGQRGMRFEDVTRRLGDRALGNRLDEVIYRLDARMSHLLLDEFQDTSPLQWQVLRPFAQRIIERGARNSFFCVGDVKQAIYGWRGGVAEIFEALESDLGKLAQRELDTSFRSAPAVIDVVNQVFGDIGQNSVLQDGDAYHLAAGAWAGRFRAHSTARADLPGYCQVVTPDEPSHSVDEAVESCLYEAARQIADLHRRAPHLGIGVLVRKNKTVARLMHRLRHLEIPASEEGGNPLTDSPAVELLLSLLTLADHPGDTAARFHVARSPLAAAAGLDRWDDDRQAWQVSLALRRALLDHGYGPTIHRYVAALAPACDRRDLGRLLQLEKLAFGYEDEATSRVGDFIELVRNQRVENRSTAAVRVMTVHQSKGLQFDVVVLPELDRDLIGQERQIVTHRPRPTEPVSVVCRYVAADYRPLLPPLFTTMFEQEKQGRVEEAISLLYVAMTRAIHALHVVIAASKEKEHRPPKTFAGVIRAALGLTAPLAPGTLAYTHGDPHWLDRLKKPPIETAAAESAELPIALAPATAQTARALERVSPSSLEGSGRIHLRHAFHVDSAAALNRGSLLHAWFEAVGWLEDGAPNDETLLALAASKPEFANLDVAGELARFRHSLSLPVVQAALSRAGYERADGTPQLFRERAFAVRRNDTLLNGKFDRLVVWFHGPTAVAADVLDLKSDVVPAERGAVSARAEIYRGQMDAYRQAAMQLYRLPAEKVSASLLFVEPGVLQPM